MCSQKNSKYGENIYWTSLNEINGYKPVKYWYEEMHGYEFTVSAFNEHTKRFTQIVWKSTVQLGVGKAKGVNGGVFVVANYDPPGNEHGRFFENVLRPLPQAKRILFRLFCQNY